MPKTSPKFGNKIKVINVDLEEPEIEVRFRISEEVDNDHSINHNRMTEIMNSIAEGGEFGIVKSES